MHALISLSSLQPLEQATNNQHGYFFFHGETEPRGLDADSDATEQTASMIKVNMLLKAPFLRATMYSLLFQYKEIF